MNQLLRALFAFIAVAFVAGFVIKADYHALGERIIGISVLFSAFIFMPLFIYHRWKDKKLEDYTLTTENIEKMKANRQKSKSKNKK